MEFNIEKFSMLLNEQSKLEQEGKFLSDVNQAKRSELSSYLAMIEDQIFWETRLEYYKLFDLFVTKKISCEDFSDEFDNLICLNRDTSARWIDYFKNEAFNSVTNLNQADFQINSKSHYFSDLIYKVSYLIDLWDPAVSLEDNVKHPDLLSSYGISDEYFRLLIEENLLPKMEKYFNKS